MELKGGQRGENSLHVLFIWLDVVDQVELGKHALAHFSTTTTRLAHRGDQLQIAHEVLLDLLAIKPVAIVDPLTQKLNRRLCTEDFHAGHVQVINKGDSFEFAALGLEAVLCTTIELRLNNLLNTLGGSTSREVDRERNLVLVQSQQNLVN